MDFQAFRRDIITKPIFSWARGVLPAMSDTEREALEAGDVWWDADLFAGNPDWSKLLVTAPAALTPEEQAFLNGPVDELCEMLDDWQIAPFPIDLPVVEHCAELIDRAVEKGLLLRRQGRRGGGEQLRPIGIAGEQVSIPPDVAGLQRLALGIRHRGNTCAPTRRSAW